jgi:enoyl-CoA hydratase
MRKGQNSYCSVNRPDNNIVPPELQEFVSQDWGILNPMKMPGLPFLLGEEIGAFCAGHDVGSASLPAGVAEEGASRLLSLQPWEPMIAAINDYAIAGGWMLAQKFDIRIATELAELGISETRSNHLPPSAVNLTR